VSTAQIDALHARLTQAGYAVYRAREPNEQSAEGTTTAAPTGPLDLGVLVNQTGKGGNGQFAGTVSHIRARPVGKGLAVDLR